MAIVSCAFKKSWLTPMSLRHPFCISRIVRVLLFPSRAMVDLELISTYDVGWLARDIVFLIVCWLRAFYQKAPPSLALCCVTKAKVFVHMKLCSGMSCSLPWVHSSCLFANNTFPSWWLLYNKSWFPGMMNVSALLSIRTVSTLELLSFQTHFWVSFSLFHKYLPRFWLWFHGSYAS